MDDGGLGGRVPKRRIRAETADADAGDGGGDYYAGGVLDAGAPLEEGCESGGAERRVSGGFCGETCVPPPPACMSAKKEKGQARTP